MVLDDQDKSPLLTPPGGGDPGVESRPTGCSRVADVRPEVTLLGRHRTTVRVAGLLRAGRGRGYLIFGTPPRARPPEAASRPPVEESLTGMDSSAGEAATGGLGSRPAQRCDGWPAGEPDHARPEVSS